MSITSKNEAGVVINSVEDSDTLNDILDYVPQHIDTWGNRQILWDFTLLNFESIDEDSIRSMIRRGKLLSEKRPGLKSAILVNSDLGFGMMRMLGFLSFERLKFEIQVFRKKEKALQWLTN